MRKRVFILVSLLIFFVLSACNNQIEDSLQVEKSKDITYDNLVTDVYTKECVYTNNLYHSETSEKEEMQVTASFHIPQIHLSSNNAKEINEEIYNLWYPQIQNVIEEIDEYGKPVTSNGMSYRWAVNDDILSLVAINNYAPDSSGGLEYLVYNLSISTGNILSNEEVYTIVNFSQTEYYDKVKQVIGSAFFQDKEEYIEQYGYDDFFRTQLEKTISDENIQNAIPYINEDGQLCVITRIYSLAAADYYWYDLNIENFKLIPAYKNYMEQGIDMTDESTIFNRYKEILAQYPEIAENGYCDTEYLVYDIDKNGIPELIVKENHTTYDIYSFDGTNTIFCGEFYWSYDDCLYEYDGNGILVHDGGTGSLHMEDVSLYTIMNGSLELSETIKSTETSTYEELNDYLENYSPMKNFHPINDDSYLPQ